MNKKTEKKLRWDERKIYPESCKVDTFIRKLERKKETILKKFPEAKTLGIFVMSNDGYVVLRFERYMTKAETREYERKIESIRKDVETFFKENPFNEE